MIFMSHACSHWSIGVKFKLDYWFDGKTCTYQKLSLNCNRSLFRTPFFVDLVKPALMPGLNSRLGYSWRLLVRCKRDEVHTNVDIHALVQVSSITRQDIWDILVSFNSGLIYRHVFESFKTRWEQVKSVEDEMNVPFTLSFSSCLILSQRECKAGIRN